MKFEIRRVQNGAVLGYMDVDLSTDLAHLPRLIEAVVRGSATWRWGRDGSPSLE